ncbi:FAD-binding protein [Acinetobacter sp. WZC-1]|uniref:FAD-binding protein n=1 Tax=Acinetobacter sp. WZC-1 TaxID=3459034 RepID=UPI00403DF330
MSNQSKLVIMLALMTGLSGCGGEWMNWFETEKVTPEYLAQPENAAQLTDYVTKASLNGKRIRMTGSGHSASDITITSDALLTPEKLNKPLSLNVNSLKNPNESQLVRVQSGIRISDLNDYLDKNGLALQNMGGYDGQTIAGVMMTATHGSGLAYGPIADQVMSLQMVVDGGRMVQIEPTNGITNPATFHGRLDENTNIPIQLIQDDDAFNAARVSIGSMGIIYSVILRTDQKFWLREVRTLTKWSELKKPDGQLDRLLRGLPVHAEGASPEHWELQYTPYADKDGDHSFLITERYRSYTPLPEQSASERGQPGTDFLSTLLTLRPVGVSAAAFLDLFPSLGKTLLETTLKSQQDDNYTNVSYKVFNIGVVNHTAALGIETAFDINQTISAIERSFSVANEEFSQGRVHSAPIAIRFVKQSNALIAMQYGHDTMFMEVIGLRDGQHVRDLLSAHQQTYLQEFNGRPHWGLDLNFLNNEAQLRALYPAWDRWKTQYHRFNVTGTFDGKTTDRLGISVRPR